MINVIGAGIAGTFMCQRLQMAGMEYRCFDSEEKYAGSRASENLIASSWYKDAPDEMHKDCEQLLSTYPMQRIEFTAGKNARFIHPNQLLKKDYIRSRVTKIPVGVLDENGIVHLGINVWCNGYWINQLMAASCRGVAGHGLIFSGQTQENILRMYKPYRHEKMFNYSSTEIWYGNSVLIEYEKYKCDRLKLIAESSNGAYKLGMKGSPEVRTGIRPKMMTRSGEYKFGFADKIDNNNYIVNGGFKAGLFVYPYLTKKILTMLCR